MPQMSEHIRQPVLAINLDRHIAKFDKATHHVPPVQRTDEQNSNRQTETKYNRDFDGHDRLQHVVNFPSNQDGKCNTQ